VKLAGHGHIRDEERPTMNHELSPSVQLSHQDDVFVLDLGATQNRFTPHRLSEIGRCLDEVLRATGPRALVTTASGNYFSIGLDLDWVADHHDEAPALVRQFHDLLARFLTSEVYTVAAVQGHCYGGGALFALAHDAIVMADDAGIFCLPEIDLPIALTDGLTALVSAKLAPSTATEALLLGERFGPRRAEHAGIVRETGPTAEFLTTAISAARTGAGKDPATLGTMKQRLYRDAVTRLRAVDLELPEQFPRY
jgi:enoyl-CoA hydratase/carnithine racemase